MRLQDYNITRVSISDCAILGYLFFSSDEAVRSLARTIGERIFPIDLSIPERESDVDMVHGLCMRAIQHRVPLRHPMHAHECAMAWAFLCRAYDESAASSITHRWSSLLTDVRSDLTREDHLRAFYDRYASAWCRDVVAKRSQFWDVDVQTLSQHPRAQLWFFDFLGTDEHVYQQTQYLFAPETDLSPILCPVEGRLDLG